MAGLEVGDLSIANKLTSLADVNRLLNEIKARERSIETLLEGLQVNRVTKEKEIATLQASTSEVWNRITFPKDQEWHLASESQTGYSISSCPYIFTFKSCPAGMAEGQRKGVKCVNLLHTPMLCTTSLHCNAVYYGTVQTHGNNLHCIAWPASYSAYNP